MVSFFFYKKDASSTNRTGFSIFHKPSKQKAKYYMKERLFNVLRLILISVKSTWKKLKLTSLRDVITLLLIVKLIKGLADIIEGICLLIEYL